MARRVRYFSTQIEKEKEKIPIRPLYDSVPLVTVGPRAAQTLDELDTKLSEHESRLVRMNENYQVLSDRMKELVEARHVLRETAVFFDRVSHSESIACHSLTFNRRRLPMRKARFEPHSTTVLPLCCNMMIGRLNTPARLSLI